VIDERLLRTCCFARLDHLNMTFRWKIGDESCTGRMNPFSLDAISPIKSNIISVELGERVASAMLAKVMGFDRAGGFNRSQSQLAAGPTPAEPWMLACQPPSMPPVARSWVIEG
jgi:hypothetical protein